MSVQGKWWIVELPGYEPDYKDMMGPAFINFEPGAGEFAFGCVTGSFPGAVAGDAVEFDWNGNDEMDEVRGQGWAERRANDTLTGEIHVHNGDDIPFIAKPWPTSSTAC
ncbi:MAG: hypothetical protein M3T55_07380 [Pseudomonadota bacterium]|nr:hypothetical protein [Pseudomonadota bacterium]